MTLVERFLSLILARILLIGSLIGCGSSSGGVGSAENTKAMSEAKGAYTEKEVNLPSDIKNIELMGRLKDGTLEAVGLNESKTEKMFYVSKGNGNHGKRGSFPKDFPWTNARIFMLAQFPLQECFLSSYSKKTPTSKVGDELRLLPT